ncbi:MAG: ECF-type sigma factor [Paludibaculum sp.]
MRRLAASYLRRERTDHTLQPTSLVHEAYLRLLEQRETGWSNRAQLIGLAASMMRRILVNYACAHDSQKRGGGALRMSIDAPDSSDPASKSTSTVDLLALDQALDQLALFHPECARIVEMKYFGGLKF